MVQRRQRLTLRDTNARAKNQTRYRRSASGVVLAELHHPLTCGGTLKTKMYNKMMVQRRVEYRLRRCHSVTTSRGRIARCLPFRTHVLAWGVPPGMKDMVYGTSDEATGNLPRTTHRLPLKRTEGSTASPKGGAALPAATFLPAITNASTTAAVGGPVDAVALAKDDDFGVGWIEPGRDPSLHHHQEGGCTRA